MPPPASSSEDPDPFERFRRGLGSRYTIGRQLGAGGMGVVYLAIDIRLNRQVAIKALHPQGTSPAARRRFAREGRVLAKLQHPNILTVHEAGELDGWWYFVMDYVEGPTLAQRLADGPLAPEAVRSLGRDLLNALEAAHQARVIHRDVKPANVFLAGDRALLADFGIASVGDPTDPDATSLTTPGQAIGTPAYMAPDAEPSPQTDIYGVGLVLYEACSGGRWLPGSDPQRGDWSRVPPALRPALKRALAVAPAARWADAGSFARALRRRPVPLLIPAATAAAALLGLIWIWDHWPRRPDCAVTPTDFAIVPFTRGGADDPIGQRLARYAGNELERFPRWKLTSVPASFAWWASASPARRAADAAAALGARFHAEGELLDGDRTVQVSIRDSCGAAYHRLTVTTPTGDLLAWGGAVADSIVRVIFPRYTDEFRDLAARGGRNGEAYTELFAGQDAFQLDDWRGAESHYLRALQLDSAFAQAAWELALVRRWRERSFEAEWRRLYEQRARLTELQQLIISAQLEADLPTRFGALEAIARRYPHNAEGLLIEADEVYHRGPLVGVSLDSALRVWDLASRRQAYSTAYGHLAVGDIRLGHRADAQRALGALREAVAHSSKEAHERAGLTSLLYDQRFRPWLARLKLRLLDWRADSTAVSHLAQYVRLGLVFDAPEVQRRIGEILVRRSRDRAIRANGYEAQGIALMAEGRPQAAIAVIDSAAALFGTPEAEIERAEWRLLPPVFGLPTAGSGSTEWARRTLAAASEGPHAARAAWALAVDAETRHDSTGLARWRVRLERATQDTPSAARLARLLEALTLGRDGNWAGALSATDSLARDDGKPGEAPFARALLHLRRGEWLATGGDPDRADRAWLWYEGWDIDGWAQREVQAGEVDAVIGVVARLRRAELAAQRGDATATCLYATRVRQLWSQSEPSYAALLRRANALEVACPD